MEIPNGLQCCGKFESMLFHCAWVHHRCNSVRKQLIVKQAQPTSIQRAEQTYRRIRFWTAGIYCRNGNCDRFHQDSEAKHGEQYGSKKATFSHTHKYDTIETGCRELFGPRGGSDG